VEVVDTVMDAVGVERAAIVCNSMGGLWGFWYALERSERVSALVELGCPALALGTSAPIFMRLVTVPGLGQAITSRMVPKSAADAAVGLARMGTPPEVINELPSAFAETAYAMFNLPTYGDAWRTLLGAVATMAGAKARYALTPQHLREVRQPVLLVWGTNDPFGRLSKAREAAALMASSRLAVVGHGHLPFLEDPASCAIHIRDHVNRVGATA
jgi:pimeloyl-ACP methyl ester carboxylesterase